MAKVCGCSKSSRATLASFYGTSGNRVLKRSISGGNSTTLTAYAYGLQELTYTSEGVLSSQTNDYSLSGHLIGSTNGSSTTYDPKAASLLP